MKDCEECANGSVPKWIPPWGWAHADEGCPMPLPCDNPPDKDDE